MDRYAVILAAGKGTRMNSRDPNHSKVSYPILGKPLINYVLDCLQVIEAKETITVVGFGGEATQEIVKNRITRKLVIFFNICYNTGERGVYGNIIRSSYTNREFG